MRRSIVLYAPSIALVAAAWVRVEEPHTPLWRVALLAALALAPALTRRTWLRAPVLVASVLVAFNVAFAPAPLGAARLSGAPWLPAGLPSALASGFLSFYDVGLPFDPAGHPLMLGMVLLAVFGFGLSLALLIAARRPLAAAFVLIAGTTWPATLDPGHGDLVLGVLVLAVALVLVVAGADRASSPPVHAALAGAAVCALAAAAAASPAVARSGLLDWQRWDPYTRSDAAISVEYVWQSSYGGIRFPKNATTVFTVRGPRRPLYWRATTLSLFDGQGWREAETLAPPVHVRGAALPREPDSVPVPGRRAALVRQRITIAALRDNHLVAATVPVAYRAPDPAGTSYGTDGTAFTRFGLARGETYTAWSIVATPTAGEVARSKARYPASLAARFLAVARGVDVPRFGAPHRRARVAAILRRRRDDPRVDPYAPLFAVALRVTGHARSPYAAAVALEAWFRLGGRFRYDEQPPAAVGAPPLVDFVLRTHRGYCQHFAGAMTLMLRYLGVPARVGAGFTSGSYDSARREWVVTDQDAHTWVEAWFSGYGWLPFDPTPSRGGLAGPYSAASTQFDAAGALGALGRAALGIRAVRGALGRGAPRAAGPLAVPAPHGRGRGAAAWALLALGASLAMAALVLAAVALAKRVRRRRSLAAGEPRALGRACRRELAAYLADQGIAVPASATTSELADLLERWLGVGAGALAAEIDAARFGSPESASAAARRLRAELEALLRRARRSLPRRRRLRGLASLRSLRLAGPA
jgi:protein-glutamine gamma-glutamyltransferase